MRKRAHTSGLIVLGLTGKAGSGFDTEVARVLVEDFSFTTVFADDAEAFWLLAVLQFKHGSRKEPFAIVSKAMAEAQVINGWGHGKYHTKKERLIELGKLRLVKRGGGEGNPNLYALVNCPGNWDEYNQTLLPPSLGEMIH